jgi:hypothetical protein
VSAALSRRKLSRPDMKKRLFLLAALITPLLRAETAVEAPAVKEQFIRVEQKEKATELQTAVVKFTKGDASVELVGAIHIADKKYYQALNSRFIGYDALLWEGIGSGKPAAPEEIREEEEMPEEAAAEVVPKKKGKLDGLHTAYETGAKWLELAYQMKEIDYTPANFVHADLSIEEFTALQEQRGESLFGFVLKAGLEADSKGIKQPSTFKLLTSLIRGSKNGLKRELVHTLGAGDDQVAGLAGESVIISDRNAKCLEVLAREVKAGKKKLGIFYGAAHFPDMAKRLLEAGWTQTGTEWMTAWDIGE